MFYSTELLSLRRKGKLAKCWLAATFSEKMFKETCRPILIKKINIVLTCEEILSTIEMRSGRNYGRFSLYLSSQLMYGAAKILLYQTKYFQALILINAKIFQISFRRHEEFNAVMALELPDVPPMEDVFRNLEIPSNSHLITEEPYTSVIGRLMQDEMNFGILSEHDMEQYLAGPELSLNEIRRFPWDQSAEIHEKSVQVPFVDVNRFEIETIETERETRVASAENDQHKPFVVPRGSDVKKPATSRKRTLISPTEIPAKKSKISPVENLPPPLPIEPPPLLIDEPPSAPELPFQLQQGLSVLKNIELIEVVKPKKTRKYFDERTQLSGSVMRKYIRNVSVHTRPLWRERSTSILLRGTEYLRQPSTKIANNSWGKTLNKLFSSCLTKPLVQTVQNDFQDVLDFEIEQTTAGETIRVGALSRLPDQTDELSSRKLMFTASEITYQSKTLEKILQTENLVAGGEEEPPEEQRKETKKFEEPLIELPEITGFEEKIGSKTHLIKKELLALMETHWSERTFIKFHDVISPESCNKFDAASTFAHCLELHAKKKIILKQAEPFDTIWIQKYPYYTSESGNSTAAAS
ncbi:meiotic recombination protein REC8 homolog [Bombus flavifrons]|uniref:meiotic recombination protein REC8 homolog n=1 Tax=Bombus flavifrons TaxID=103934 RepID=UPI003704CE88